MRALSLVGHIVTYSEQVGRPATNMRLQALLYRIQQKYLERHGAVAFDDRTEYAGEIPFFSDVYYEYARCGGYPVICVPLSPVVDDLLADSIKDVVNRFSGVPTWKMISTIIQERRKSA
jgi:uncharacterized phage-associated protein